MKKSLFVSFFSGVLVTASVTILFISFAPVKNDSTREELSLEESPASPPAEENAGFSEILVLGSSPASKGREEKASDFILETYRKPELQNKVVGFFSGLTQSEEIASLMLSNASLFNVSPSLTFALCWEESRYNPRAVNRKNRNNSIDRGLFQLNEKSFPDLAEADFFNPGVNAWYGLSHLRWCLDTAGTEVAGLAMYNAGTNRVQAGGTPKNTLDYVSRILENRRRIEERFFAEYPRIASAPKPVADEPPRETARFRFSLLTPLGGR